jgi:hypothetical protein
MLFAGGPAFTQTIDLDEILNIRSMDSIELNEYATKKGFKLKGITEIPDKLLYKYYLEQDSLVWFVRSFPKDTTRDKHVYFYYSAYKLSSQFKKQLIKQKFKLDSRENSDYDGNLTRRDSYLKDGMEVILGSEAVAGKPERYVLMYQKQFKKYVIKSPNPKR